MRCIPTFPNFEPISAYMHQELYPFLNSLPEGISEFTFLTLYLHKAKYNYHISSLANQTYMLRGEDKLGKFFCLLGNKVAKEIITDLIANYGRWKLISQTYYDEYKNYFLELGFTVEEDRNNEDYLYNKEKLASLAGKSLQKKRNLANNFEKSYAYEVKILDSSTAADAGKVLDLWNKTRPENILTDYEQCFYSMSLLSFIDQHGIIVYADGEPVAWALGEYIANGKVFVVHFEKGLDEYKGIYQFVNRATAQSLKDSVEYINREQDLGDEGLRQAKLTYRPSSFVQKYVIKNEG